MTVPRKKLEYRLPAGQSLQAAVVAIGAYFPGAQGVGQLELNGHSVPGGQTPPSPRNDPATAGEAMLTPKQQTTANVSTCT